MSDDFLRRRLLAETDTDTRYNLTIALLAWPYWSDAQRATAYSLYH